MLGNAVMPIAEIWGDALGIIFPSKSNRIHVILRPRIEPVIYRSGPICRGVDSRIPSLDHPSILSFLHLIRFHFLIVLRMPTMQNSRARWFV